MPKAKTVPAGDPKIDAIAVTALTKQPKPKAHRDLLAEGSYDVDLTIKGTVDGRPWAHKISGALTVNPDKENVPGSTPWDELLESALCAMTQPARRAWLDQLSAGEVPQASCGIKKREEVAAELKPAAELFRAANPVPKRGDVSFVPN